MSQNSKILRSERLCEPDAIRHARAFLEDYQRATDLLSLYECERSDRSGLPGVHFSATRQERADQAAHWRARAQEILQMLEEIPSYREKMLLHYHYILGYSVESAAEAMDISRSSAFRLKKCGLELMAYLLAQRDGKRAS
jgi:DNA-directed RNA polymerase specialized sigma24 family protein